MPICPNCKTDHEEKAKEEMPNFMRLTTAINELREQDPDEIFDRASEFIIMKSAEENLAELLADEDVVDAEQVELLMNFGIQMARIFYAVGAKTPDIFKEFTFVPHPSKEEVAEKWDNVLDARKVRDEKLAAAEKVGVPREVAQMFAELGIDTSNVFVLRL